MMTRLGGDAARLIIVVLVMCGVVAVYMPALTRTIEYDEAFTSLNYSVDPSIAIFGYSFPNNHLLYSLSAWASQGVWGHNLIGLRFPAWAAALLSLALIFRMGQRIGGFSAGLASIVLLGGALLFQQYATEGRGYTLTGLLALMLLYQVEWKRPNPSHRYRYTLMLLCFLLMITLISMAFWIAVMLGWLILRDRLNRYNFTNVYWPMIIGSLLGLTPYSYAFAVGRIQAHATFFGYQDFVLLGRDLLLTFFTPNLFGLCLALAFVVGIIRLWQLQRQKAQMILCLALLTLILSIAQWVITDRLLYPRNYFYLLPMIALIAGMCFAHLHTSVLLGLIAFMIGASTLGVAQLQRPSDRLNTVYQIFQQHLTPTDSLLGGCCLDYPLYHRFRQTIDERIYIITPQTTRIILWIDEVNTPEKIIQDYKLEPFITMDECAPEQWDQLTVLVCSLES
ncbi:MAG: hypothetical protein MUF87_07395 [Anaerolineae bacterium]|jgi:hypothetical protein|nr:hypothetical protein [Anaerolineae bacterium]